MIVEFWNIINEITFVMLYWESLKCNIVLINYDRRVLNTESIIWYDPQQTFTTNIHYKVGNMTVIKPVNKASFKWLFHYNCRVGLSKGRK